MSEKNPKKRQDLGARPKPEKEQQTQTVSSVANLNRSKTGKNLDLKSHDKPFSLEDLSGEPPTHDRSGKRKNRRLATPEQ